MVNLDRLLPLNDDMSAEELREWIKFGREHGEIDFSKVNPQAETVEQKTIRKSKRDDSVAHTEVERVDEKMMLQPTKRMIELRELMNREKNPEKRKKYDAELTKEIRNDPTRQRLKKIFA